MLLFTGLEIFLVKGLPWAVRFIQAHSNFLLIGHAFGWVGTLKLTLALGITAGGVMWTGEMIELLKKAIEKMRKGDISGAGDALSVLSQVMGVYGVFAHRELFLDKVRKYLQKSGNNSKDTEQLISGFAEVLQSTKSWK